MPCARASGGRPNRRAGRPWLEQQILALALAHPGWGPDRLAVELRRPRWSGHRRSPHGIWNVLRRAGLNTRAKRLGLIAVYRAPPEPRRQRPEPVRHIEAAQPGDLVQLDCFHVGQVAGSRGRTWRYTAIDVASSYTWASLHNTPRNPAARHTAALAQQVAADLARHGWRLQRVSTDNAGEFTSATFTDSRRRAGVRHTRIRAGRPQSNGCVERVHQTILEDCYRPTFARALIPRFTALRADLVQYLRYYNHDRAHTGRRIQGRTPRPRPWSCQSVAPEAVEMSRTRRYISGRGHPSAASRSLVGIDEIYSPQGYETCITGKRPPHSPKNTCSPTGFHASLI